MSQRIFSGNYDARWQRVIEDNLLAGEVNGAYEALKKCPALDEDPSKDNLAEATRRTIAIMEAQRAILSHVMERLEPKPSEELVGYRKLGPLAEVGQKLKTLEEYLSLGTPGAIRRNLDNLKGYQEIGDAADFERARSYEVAHKDSERRTLQSLATFNP